MHREKQGVGAIGWMQDVPRPELAKGRQRADDEPAAPDGDLHLTADQLPGARVRKKPGPRCVVASEIGPDVRVFGHRGSRMLGDWVSNSEQRPQQRLSQEVRADERGGIREHDNAEPLVGGDQQGRSKSRVVAVVARDSMLSYVIEEEREAHAWKAWVHRKLRGHHLRQRFGPEHIAGRARSPAQQPLGVCGHVRQG